MLFFLALLFLFSPACLKVTKLEENRDPLPYDADSDIGDETSDFGCPPGLTDCSGSCVDTSSNHSHCGRCNKECESFEVCSEGRCLLECPSDRTECGGACVNLEEDIYNCGGCGIVCEAAMNAYAVCAAGACSTSCYEGWSDRDGDGSCETPCEAAETCNGFDDDCDGKVDEICITLPGLRGYWRFEEDGGTRYDETDFHNDLTEAASMGRGEGKVGYAADFEAANGEYLYRDDDPDLDITGSVTIVAWVKARGFRLTEENPKSRNDIVMKWNGSAYECSYFFTIEADPGDTHSNYLDHPHLYLWLNPPDSDCWGDSGTSVEIPETLLADTWYHVAAVYDQAAGTKYYYFNGVRFDSSSTPVTSIKNSSARFTVGRRGGCEDCLWDGWIDEVAIFDRVLSDEEIGEIYELYLH